MEKVLVLDAYANQKVAVLINNKIVSENVSNLPHSDTFMQLIDKTINDANLKIDDITKIALNIGPGSFTGIRVATSIAKVSPADLAMYSSLLSTIDGASPAWKIFMVSLSAPSPMIILPSRFSTFSFLDTAKVSVEVFSAFVLTYLIQSEHCWSIL